MYKSEENSNPKPLKEEYEEISEEEDFNEDELDDLK
jgi:hypothetical protein